MNEKTKTKKCVYCKNEIDAHAIICMNCKKKQGKIKKCPYCKDKILAKETTCPNCGKNLRKLQWVAIFVVVFVLAIGIALAMQGIQNMEKDIANKMGVSKEQAAVIKDTLEKVGVLVVNEIERDEALDDYYLNGGTDKGYRIAFRGHYTNNVPDTVIINITEDGKILVIKEPMGNVLYENDKVINKIKT